MKCSDIVKLLSELAPESCACDWDNPGLLAGRSDKEVKTIYIALDATDEVVEAAVSCGADMLLTHHPLIFKAIKKVNDQNFITRRLVRLIQADISYYAMHTNFDSAPGCMADLAAGKLGLTDCLPLESLGQLGESPYGVGKTGFLAEPMTVRELGQFVKEAFHLPFAQIYGPALLDQTVSRVSVCPGAGGSEIEGALAAGSQALITGDISHHQGIDAAARGMAVIDGGHYGLEQMFIPFMEEYLKNRLKDQGILLIPAKEAWPTVLI